MELEEEWCTLLDSKSLSCVNWCCMGEPGAGAAVKAGQGEAKIGVMQAVPVGHSMSRVLPCRCQGLQVA